ncbi:MAG TPA: response regulator [Gammaproteobacteria bacterium]|nr:response regulator [Gammaproteobacteria bacterium]
MAASSGSGLAVKLAALQVNFKQQLSGKLAEIERLWAGCYQNNASSANLVDLHRMVHSLAGSSATFGAVAVSLVAREVEQTLKLLLKEPGQASPFSSEIQQQLDELLPRLRQAAEEWQPSNIFSIRPGESKDQCAGNLVYLVEDDELLAADLVAKLEQANYRVQHFTELSGLEAACEKEIPVAIIMDMVFRDGNIVGAEHIPRIVDKLHISPLVIFISEHDEIEARLAAVRAGSHRFFCKPLKVNKLIRALDGLTARQEKTPYRVLLIDDDETLLEYCATVLREAGMDVETLSNPLQGLKVLTEFKPDVVIMDVYMSECSGPELAQVIRQDDAWVMVPVIFLSVESDLNRQLAALNLGGDDFLVKPVEAGHLVAVVTARAKRARRTIQLNKDLKNALRESKFQLFTMDQHDIVSTTDVTGRIISVNDKFCEISGYSREELLGQNHRILKSGYHPDSFYKDLWNTITQGKVWHGTICNCRRDGNEYWVESTIVPFLDNNGKPYKYVHARTDITALRQSEERLHSSQVFANIGTWDWHIRTGEMYWSVLVGPMLGYQQGDPDTTYENFLFAVHPDDRQMVEKAVNSCIEHGCEFNIEYRIVWPDGSVHWLQAGGDVLRTEAGEPLHMLGVIQDISIRKCAERDLIKTRDEAEYANRAKSQFLSSMSHELRTPMNAIIGFSQLLRIDNDQPLNESQQENVDEILKASNHLLELINEVLDLARIETGRIDLSIETVVPGEVIAESLQLITPLAQKRGIEISLTLDGANITFEQVLQQHNAVRADRTRLKQVLLNLLSNAVKYNCENGKLIIACNNTENNQTRISISDTGTGLTMEQQSQLFKVFNRLGAEQSNIEGTGVGLVITRNIVELMGGSIGVESQSGKGSTFWIELPNATLHSAQKKESDKKGAMQVHTIIRPEYKHTVLYIEDNPANLRLVAQLLGRLPDIHMWSAHEPLLGLELAVEHNPDLILLDINLPGMNGFEVLNQLRQREATRETPVIAISANAMPGDIKKGLEAGFDEYITKPIDVEALLQALDTMLTGNNK